MIVIALLATVGYGCDLITSAMASGLGQTNLGISFMPALISYAVYYHKPERAVCISFIFGIGSDVLSGTSLGIHLIVSLSLWFGCAATASFLPRARGALLWAHMLMASLLWHISVAVLLGIQGYAALGSLGMGIFITAAAEAGIGLWLVRRVHKLLEYTGQRRALSDMLFLGRP